MTDVADRTQHLFVVRVWQESGDIAPGPWRGSVEHVRSGQRLYFVSLTDLADFITWRAKSVSQTESLTDTDLSGSCS